MKKIYKILRKSNKNKLLKNKIIKRKIKSLISKLNTFNIKYKVNNELDYYQLCIFNNSLKQKRILENNYDLTRSNNLDMWNLIDNKQKNMFALKQREDSNIKLNCFMYNDKVITITFFDELFNSLYYKEPSIFELKQFNSLYNKFDTNIIDKYYYGFLPYISGFIDEEIIYNTDDYICIYNNYVKKIYIIYSDLRIEELALNKKLKEFNLEKDLLLAFINKDVETFLLLVKDSKLFSDKTKKKLNKVKR